MAPATSAGEDILCGLTSPWLTLAKLTRHPLFGVMAAFPFQEVLAALHQTSRAPARRL